MAPRAGDQAEPLREYLELLDGGESSAAVVDVRAGAREFSLRYDFLPLATQPHRLLLPMRTIERKFGA